MSQCSIDWMQFLLLFSLHPSVGMSAAGHADTGGTANSTNDDNDNMQDDPLYACRGQTNKRQPSTDDGL
jgi:hypothetical protein